MDKETLSNYGWIVICVMVLAVMIALAGPFGTFVAGAIKSTTAGLFGVNQNALGAAGITIDDQAFANGPSITFNPELSTDKNNPTEATGTSFTLSGTVSSDKGIKTLTVNGTEVTIQADGTWTTTLTLTKNEVKEVTVVATDNEDTATSKTGYVAFIEYTRIAIDRSNLTTVMGFDVSLSDYVIPAKVYYNSQWYKTYAINAYSFMDKTNLVTVYMPDCIETMDQQAFKNCTSLESIRLSESLTQITQSAFYGCTSLENIVIPDNVTTIVKTAFQNCSGLNSVTIGKNVTEIGVWAFNGCTSLSEIIFKGTVDEWNAITFGSGWNVNVPATQVVCTDGTVSLK